MASGLKPARIDAAPSWRLRELGGTSIFEVYRFFTPVVTPHHGSRRDRKDGEWMHGQQPSDVQQTEKRIIFVGLDQKPFTQALEEDYRNSVFAAATVAVMALVGFISLFWAYTRELKRLQAEVRRNDRLAALGNLAAGVAHEIRNPLSTIKVLATYLAKTMTPNGDNEETAKTMVGEIDRLNRVVSELLDFAHPTVPTFSQVDLNETIRRALRLADADIKSKNITARFMENPALHAVFLNPERFIQALLNLILNAVQSMDKGGDLTLSANTLPGKLFSVEISDTGRGMSKEVLADIFTPYFTTRASGTGLGLAIVQQIIEGHGGTITARSTLGKGSLFTITLPMRESSEE
jgi:two-component system sensor histidine kinase HydH